MLKQEQRLAMVMVSALSSMPASESQKEVANSMPDSSEANSTRTIPMVNSARASK